MLVAWAFVTTAFLFLATCDYITEPPLPFSENPENNIQCCSHKNIPQKEIVGPSEQDKANKKHQSGEKRHEKEDRIRRSDLAAQRGMWRATNAVAIIAFFQTIVTTIGIVLLYVTLKATRETIDFGQRTLGITQSIAKTTDETLAQAIAATEQAKQQTTAVAESARFTAETERARAYVEFEIKNPKSTSGIKDTSAFAVEVWAVNYGKTPAMEFGFNAWISVGLDSENSIDNDGRYVGVLGPGRDNAKLVARFPSHGYRRAADGTKYHICCNWRFQEILGDRFKGLTGYWYQQSGRSREFVVGASGPTSLTREE